MKSKLVKTGLILYILSYIGGVISALFYQNLGMGFGLLYYYMLFPLFASLIGIGIGWHRFFAGIGILFGLFFLSSLHTCLVGGTMDLFIGALTFVPSIFCLLVAVIMKQIYSIRK